MPDPEKLKIKKKIGDPYFRTKKEWDKYYTKKAFEKLGEQNRVQQMADDPVANMEVNVATKAEIPDFKEWEISQRKEKASKTKRTEMPAGDVSGGSSPKGYRYNSGQGKPAKGSLTNRLKKSMKTRGY